MKHCIGALLCALAASLGSCAATHDSRADVESIRDLIRTTATTNNAGDAQGWTALFEDGAVYMPPGLPAVTTREALYELAQTGFSSWSSDLEIVPDEIVVHGDWAFARMRVTERATSKASGDSVPIDLEEIVIYQRQSDGGWKIARLIGNRNG